MSGQHSVGETVCAKKCYVFPTSRDFFLFNLGLAPLFQTSLLTAASETNDTIKKYKQPTATVIVHLFFKISVPGLFHIKCRRFEESWAFQWGISDLRSNPKNNDFLYDWYGMCQSRRSCPIRSHPANPQKPRSNSVST